MSKQITNNALADVDPNSTEGQQEHVCVNAALRDVTTNQNAPAVGSNCADLIVNGQPVATPTSSTASLDDDVSQYCDQIIDLLMMQESTMVRDATYLQRQPEITERMRTILMDWMVDVSLKFKLHPETFFLSADLVDRYLMCRTGSRASLQLVGITCVLLAAKHEEVWAPEIKDCVFICANTYTRDEIIVMERDITAALNFRLTVPTPYPMLCRLLETTQASPRQRHTALFFLENAMLDYQMLAYQPSRIACASLLLARLIDAHEGDSVTPEQLWDEQCRRDSKLGLEDICPCAATLLAFTSLNCSATSRYQALRRKYSSTRFSEVAKVSLPSGLPRCLCHNAPAEEPQQPSTTESVESLSKAV